VKAIKQECKQLSKNASNIARKQQLSKSASNKASKQAIKQECKQ